MLQKFPAEAVLRKGEMGVTAGIVEFADFDNAEQEGPHLVRSGKADLQRRINGQLTLRHEAGGLTSFAGFGSGRAIDSPAGSLGAIEGRGEGVAAERFQCGAAVAAGIRDAGRGRSTGSPRGVFVGRSAGGAAVRTEAAADPAHAGALAARFRWGRSRGAARGQRASRGGRDRAQLEASTASVVERQSQRRRTRLRTRIERPPNRRRPTPHAFPDTVTPLDLPKSQSSRPVTAGAGKQVPSRRLSRGQEFASTVVPHRRTDSGHATLVG